MPGIGSRPGSAISWCRAQETARPLLTPGEIMQLPPADEIVMVAGTPPIRAKKARYYEDAKETTEPTPAEEFAAVLDDDEDGVRQSRLIRQQMRGVARQVAMDPNDGMEL
jgi:type IV secretory pathway TraG/TraD family ATPase VirD4